MINSWRRCSTTRTKTNKRIKMPCPVRDGFLYGLHFYQGCQNSFGGLQASRLTQLEVGSSETKRRRPTCTSQAQLDHTATAGLSFFKMHAFQRMGSSFSAICGWRSCVRPHAHAAISYNDNLLPAPSGAGVFLLLSVFPCSLVKITGNPCKIFAFAV